MDEGSSRIPLRFNVHHFLLMNFTIEILTPWLLSLVFNLISRSLWRNLEKMKGSKFFLKVGGGEGEVECVLIDFKMKWNGLNCYKAI